MAKILYEVKKNQNTSSSAYGKWFAQIKTLETLNTRKLANHISEHGSIYTPDVVYGVLEKFRSCLIEMLLESKKVKIEGLGTFYCTVENQKGGAAKKEDFQREQAPEGAAHPIPARAGAGAEHLEPRVPEEGRVHQHRAVAQEPGVGHHHRDFAGRRHHRGRRRQWRTEHRRAVNRYSS